MHVFDGKKPEFPFFDFPIFRYSRHFLLDVVRTCLVSGFADLWRLDTSRMALVCAPRTLWWMFQALLCSPVSWLINIPVALNVWGVWFLLAWFSWPLPRPFLIFRAIHTGSELQFGAKFQLVTGVNGPGHTECDANFFAACNHWCERHCIEHQLKTKWCDLAQTNLVSNSQQWISISWFGKSLNSWCFVFDLKVSIPGLIFSWFEFYISAKIPVVVNWILCNFTVLFYCWDWWDSIEKITDYCDCNIFLWAKFIVHKAPFTQDAEHLATGERNLWNTLQ